jgi:flagellar biosynthetic protein FliR
MHSSPSLPIATLYSFLLVLARISGAVVFVPIPGIAAAPATARAVVSLSLTMCLFPVWPPISALPNPGLLTGWMLSEAAFGIGIGLLVSFLSESFVVFGQMVGLQAGYSFASVVDPNTQADSSVFIVLAQTIAGLLFFTCGLHLEVFRALAMSLQTQPPGALLSARSVLAVSRLGSTIFSTGLKLAFPVIALLIMVDIALALLGRINSQLQLLTVAFPAKMLVALGMITAMAVLLPHVYRAYAARLVSALPALTGR